MNQIPKILRVPFFAGRFSVPGNISLHRLCNILSLFFLILGPGRLNSQQISRPRQLTQPGFEDQNQNTLYIQYAGTIKGDRIEGTGRTIRDT